MSGANESTHLVPKKYPELVFGLIGPVGTDLKATSKILKKALTNLGYNVPKQEIRLSKLIEELLRENYSNFPENVRISKLMDAGTRIRECSGDGGAIAYLALAGIAKTRLEEFSNEFEKNAYILHSLKHPDEVKTLRNIYGKGFFAISVYSPRDARVDALAARITKSKHLDSKGARAFAEELIERDEQEEGHALGQDVKDAFPIADLFLDVTDKVQLEKNVNRFVELLFGHPNHTPTREEYGMYHAKSAALRSSDLARQVGAAITSEECDIIAVGCNDVPKAGGGLYWADDKPDGRDFQLGRDATYEQREQILAELINRFQNDNLINKDADVKALVNSLLLGNKKKVLKGTQISGLIEFGRSVHAEMAAIMDGARRGVSVKDAILYTTTFPCHLCAKHIIASGIKRVVYIEPYPKSKARILYSDSIDFSQTKSTINKICFEPFVGVAPRQYMDLFEMPSEDSRKDDSGEAIEWSTSTARPRLKRFMNTYKLMEQKLIAEIIPALAVKLGINPEPNTGESE